MRHDPQIEVVCDKCDGNEYWEPEFKYSDYSGKSGSYDTSDGAFTQWCEDNGWIEGGGEKTYCGEDCVPTTNSEKE